MFSTITAKPLGNKSFFSNVDNAVFLGVMMVISATLYYCLVESTAVPLVAIAIPLCLYDRAYMFPMLLTITLCQGAFESAEIQGASSNQDSSYAETLIIAAVSPMLFYDLTTQKSKLIPYRFVIFYVMFFLIVYIGMFVYYQHPENYQRLTIGSARYAAVLHSIVKSIKIVFYIFYLKVLINYPIEKNLKTLEYTRRFVPFVLIILCLNLLINGRVQNGAGYTGTLQLGDAHHGSFTSQLCSLGIYCFITFFMRKASWITRGFALAGIAAIGVSIMLMGSRNGLLSLALVCGIGFLINIKGKRIDFQFIMVVLAMIACVITVLLSLDSPTLQRAIYMTETEGGGDRVYYWEAGYKALTENPLFGLGGDESASQGAVSRYAPAAVEDKVMHNTYLEMAVEYGLLGAIFYLLFLFFALKWGYRLYKFAHEKSMLLLAAPPVSYFILMVAALFISDVWDTAIWYNLSMLLALSIQLVYYKYINKKNINTTATFAQQALPL